MQANNLSGKTSLKWDCQENYSNVKPFMTIRQTAAVGIMSEHYLRLRQKQNKLPGFCSGNRFIIDVHALIDMLHREALAACGGASE